MRQTGQRECLYCGMLHELQRADISERTVPAYCSKCDSSLLDQSDGSTLTVDIAHHHETVNQALDKLGQAMDRAWQGYARRLRLITGNGAIRDAVLAELHFQQQKGVILDYREERGNRGAVLARIR